MKLAAKLFVLAISASMARAGVTDVQILDYGTFAKTVSQNFSIAPQSITGESNGEVETKLIEKTTNIRAALGLSFGIRVKFNGKPAGKVIRCTAQCIHPKFTDPISHHTSDLDQWENYGTIGESGFIGYKFEKPWELVPGKWVIQLFIDQSLVAEKTFNVTIAPQTETASPSASALPSPSPAPAETP